MRLLRKKKAQSSLEFVSIASFMFLIFISTFITIEGRMSEVYKDKLYKSMGEVSRLVDAEIRMAYSATGDYERVFFLPNHLGELNYSIKITDEAEITITSEGLDYVFFLDHSVSGEISKGQNKITKINDVINITYLCLGGPGNDDDRCGILDCSWYYNVQSPEYWTCYNKTNIIEDRCEAIGKCKEPDLIYCSFQDNNENPAYSCDNQCQFIVGCSLTNRGYCANQTNTHPCTIGVDAGHCDGLGNCIPW